MPNGKTVNKLPVAVTMGCPAGVGPEIVLKAADDQNLQVPVLVIGDSSILKAVAARLNLSQIKIKSWKPAQPVLSEKNLIYCLDVTRLQPRQIKPGHPDSLTGRSSFEYITKAVELCRAGLALGIATAPISKTGLRLAGIDYPGHTEILAHLTGTEDYLMMMTGKRLKVTLSTIHIPIREITRHLNIDRVFRTIKLTWQTLRKDFAVSEPVIGVCGLNPHAGEGGMFGDEEEKIITPACILAQKEGIKTLGPLPPDTIFYHASKGAFDAVVCQYHDQGLIPFKLLHFKDGVNVTCGLPIVRTSVAHGTAYDISWMGQANYHSMKAAIELASFIAKNRSKFQG